MGNLITHLTEITGVIGIILMVGAVVSVIIKHNRK